MFADGSVVKSKSYYIVSMTITQQDDYILKNFLHYAKIETTIWTTHKEDVKPRSQINIYSKKMYDDLNALGCEQNKSSKENLKLPILDDTLIPHFIRGYFDGDGIAFSNGRLGFCGNKNILEYINNYFNKILQNNNVSITYNSSNNIYYLVYNKKAHIEQILNILYKDCDNLFLTRKYQKYRPLL